MAICQRHLSLLPDLVFSESE